MIVVSTALAGPLDPPPQGPDDGPVTSMGVEVDLDAAAAALVDGQWADALAMARAGLVRDPDQATAWRAVLSTALREEHAIPQEPDRPYPRVQLGFDLGTPTQVRGGYDVGVLSFGLAVGEVLLPHRFTGTAPAWHVGVDEDAWLDLPVSRRWLALEFSLGGDEDPVFHAETGVGVRVGVGPVSALVGGRVFTASGTPAYPLFAVGGLW